jgi:hypothetical protein
VTTLLRLPTPGRHVSGAAALKPLPATGHRPPATGAANGIPHHHASPYPIPTSTTRNPLPHNIVPRPRKTDLHPAANTTPSHSPDSAQTRCPPTGPGRPLSNTQTNHRRPRSASAGHPPRPLTAKPSDSTPPLNGSIVAAALKPGQQITAQLASTHPWSPTDHPGQPSDSSNPKQCVRHQRPDHRLNEVNLLPCPSRSASAQPSAQNTNSNAFNDPTPRRTYGRWLAEADVPEPFINAEPGAFVRGRIREFIRTWPNLTQITVSGTHFNGSSVIGVRWRSGADREAGRISAPVGMAGAANSQTTNGFGDADVRSVNSKRQSGRTRCGGHACRVK